MQEYFRIVFLLLQHNYKHVITKNKLYSNAIQNFYIKINNYIFNESCPCIKQEISNIDDNMLIFTDISKQITKKFFLGDYDLSFKNVLQVSAEEHLMIDFPLFEAYPFIKLHASQSVVHLHYKAHVIRLLNLLHLCKYHNVIMYILKHISNFNLFMELLKLGCYVMDNHTIMNIMNWLDDIHLNEEKSVHVWELLKFFFGDLPHPCLSDCDKIRELVCKIRTRILNHMSIPNLIKYCSVTDIKLIKHICNVQGDIRIVKHGTIFPTSLKFCHFYQANIYNLYHSVKRHPLIIKDDTSIIISKEQNVIEILHGILKLDKCCNPYDIYMSWKRAVNDKYCQVTKTCLQYLAYDFKELQNYPIIELSEYDFLQLIEAMPIADEVETIKVCCIIEWCENNTKSITPFIKYVNKNLVNIEELKKYRIVSPLLRSSLISFICNCLSFQYHKLAQEMATSAYLHDDNENIDNLLTKHKALLNSNVYDFTYSHKKQKTKK